MHKKQELFKIKPAVGQYPVNELTTALSWTTSLSPSTLNYFIY